MKDIFTNNVLIKALFITVACLLIWKLASILVLLFAAVLFAIFLVHLAKLSSNYIPVGYVANLIGVSLAIAVLFFGLFASFAPFLQDQFSLFAEQVSTSFTDLQNLLSQFGISGVDSLREQILNSSSSIIGRASNLAAAVLNIGSSISALVVLTFFFALSPTVYKEGFMKLIPKDNTKKVSLLLDDLYNSLWRWLLGRLGSMVAVAVLTMFGLGIIGMELAVPLGLLAGLFCFIPTFGPLLSVVPALLFGLSDGWMQLLYICIVYVGVQLIEGNVITPLIQQKMVSIPPALLLTAQIIFGTLLGALGIIFAVPMMLAIMITVQHLYVKELR